MGSWLAAHRTPLFYAHSKGVIHRDLKPSNVMITNEGVVKITDFGIARCIAEGSNMTRSLTGTPKYISPEQVEGKEIDHRSDIFSLGVVAYELLTGQAAFRGETLTEIIQQVVQEIPPPPSSINAEIPTALDDSVMKAMEKDRDKRHTDMNAFENALLSATGDSDTKGTIPGVIVPPEPPRKSWLDSIFLRYVAALLLGVLFALAAIASVQLGWWKHIR